MCNKIENYVNVLFSDIPCSQRASEAKDEILSKLNAYYDDCIANGCNENEAYTKAVSSLEDIDKLLDELKPDIAELKSQIEYHRIRRAKITSIAVAMYIISAAILVASSITENEITVLLAVVALLLIVAIATGMIVYVNMSIPGEIRPYLSEHSETENNKKGKDEIFSAVVAAFWLLTVAVYLGLSFLFNAWHLTWIIWIIAPAVYQLIKISFLTKK